MEKRYVIGIDYGTESGRAVLVDAGDGRELAVHVTRYPHGVIEERMPQSGRKLAPGWALQHPGDYLEVLRVSVSEVLRAAGVAPQQVIGLGVDFTSCTMLPVDADGEALCLRESFREEPHAYVKLWKHYAAVEEGARIQELAEAEAAGWLSRYGGKISCEWMLPKAWQLLNEAPEVYEAADLLMEAGDWIVYRLTGRPVRSACSAGYKALWSEEEGYPAPSFLAGLDARLAGIAATKWAGPVLPLGAKAGELTGEAAALTGLCPGTAVAVALIDAHAGAVGTGAVRPGQMVMAMGTSLCHMLLSDREVHVAGIRGVVRGGIVPELYGYEAGQPAVGDLFGWFVGQAVPAYVEREAAGEGVSVHAWLESRAAQLKPGQHGLLALDWWNGNRSVLVDPDLSGLIVGLTLRTKPEDIYRALLEAAAFGTRLIIETYERSGLPVNELLACGGLPGRNRLLMQIFADVTGREIRVAGSVQTTALGAAMYGAVAAGPAEGGCADITEAALRMARLQEETFRPNPEHKIVYERLYREYCRLYERFGRGELAVMKELNHIKLEQSGLHGNKP
ncbi:L-ribulokinase [Paenibacillus sp. UNCCL117]|uniref:ribulokinase n=1 Tax=unclassified Paenibacillus TaxID=185978 RepID=UPI000888AC85|nr:MULTISPECIES: ribulokinase [unclassified Paenibacillus]SDE56327.1 L-ribulokinase [Paenibacillus sp. cl123]SFW66202.1 L-ribulokinase [Paenibacillus sp. UNCCL117]